MTPAEAKLIKALLGLVPFLFHTDDCEIHMTDFCTCGLTKARHEAGEAVDEVKKNV
jgi:hypothetical protein